MDLQDGAHRVNQTATTMATVRVICAVATQGKPNGSYTTIYKLSYSVDGVSWNVYKEENVEKV